MKNSITSYSILTATVLLVACNPMNLLAETLNGRAIADTFDDPRLVELAKAGCDGDAVQVEDLVASGVDVDGRGFAGTTPLRWALRCKSIEGMAALLRAGANPNLEGVEELGGYSSLEDAVALRDSAYLQVLLENGADPNWVDSDGKPILHTAFYQAFMRRPEYWGNYYLLMERGADINKPWREGEGLASAAISPNNISKAIELLEQGYSYNLDGLAFTCYTAVVESDQFDNEDFERDLARVVALLIERDVDIDKAKSRALSNGEKVGNNYNFSFERFLE